MFRSDPDPTFFKYGLENFQARMRIRPKYPNPDIMQPCHTKKQDAHIYNDDFFFDLYK